LNKKKRALITIFSVFSILVGLSGMIISLTGISFINSHIREFKNISDLGQSVGRVIGDASQMLKNSDDASIDIAESLRTANNTIIYASEISYDSGEAFNQVADIVGFEVLGYSPLADSEEYFRDIGSNLIGLSEELETVQINLEENASDIESIGGDLNSISEELSIVSAKFSHTIESFSIYNIVNTIKYILIYIIIINAVFILNGIMFLILRT
jgi:hypothetical protein